MCPGQGVQWRANTALPSPAFVCMHPVMYELDDKMFVNRGKGPAKTQTAQRQRGVEIGMGYVTAEKPRRAWCCGTG